GDILRRFILHSADLVREREQLARVAVEVTGIGHFAKIEDGAVEDASVALQIRAAGAFDLFGRDGFAAQEGAGERTRSDDGGCSKREITDRGKDHGRLRGTIQSSSPVCIARGRATPPKMLLRARKYNFSH